MSGIFEGGSLLGLDDGDALPTEVVPDGTVLPTTTFNTMESAGSNMSLRSVPRAPGEPELGPESYIVPTIFAIICVVGLAGNSLVVFIALKYQQMKSVSNYYIVNLAIADMAFLVCCVPFSAAGFATTSWNFGQFLCKAVNYFMQVTVQATCLTLAALSVDRYLAIVHPVRSLVYRTKPKAIATSACIWIGSFLVSIPVAIYQKEVEGYWFGPQTYCRRQFPSQEAAQAYMIYAVLISYVLPMLLSATCYTLILRRLRQPTVNPEGNNPIILAHQAKRVRKVAWMVATVVLLFTLCWLPNHVLNLWRYLDPAAPMTKVVYYAKMAALCLSYANSAVNPIVYSFMGDDFRKNFKKLFPKCFRVNAVVPAVEHLELPGSGPDNNIRKTSEINVETDPSAK